MIGAIYIYQRSLAVRTEIAKIPIDADNVGRFLGASFAHLLLLIPIVYFGAAFGRFALRVAPPRLTGLIRFGALILTLLPLLLLAYYPITFLLSFLISSQTLQTIQPIAIDAAAFSVLCLIWFVAFSLPLIKRHLKPLLFLQRPYVLFLRRFSRFQTGQ